MAGRRLIWQLFPTYLLLTLASLLAITGYAAQSVNTFHREHLKDGLTSQAALASHQIDQLLKAGRISEVDALAKILGNAADTRITVILPSGEVVGDSHESPSRMDNHANRPEIRAAFAGEAASATRFSRTLQRTMMYVAQPVADDGRITAVVRTAIPAVVIDESLSSFFMRIGFAGAVVALLAAIVSWVVARRIAQPLEQLKQGAERFAAGDFTRPLPVPESAEFARVAEAMNEMASQLDDRIRAVISQTTQQEAVLASMTEGVLAVDRQGRILAVNRAAARLIDADERSVVGKRIPEAVRNSALQRFVADALASTDPIEREILFTGPSTQVLQTHGAVLRDTQGHPMGAVIVMNDVTHLRRLEQVRKDFVANVSHELRTPITSIKGFVETLLSGSLDNPEDTERFLKIVAKQADRLNAIIEDLLILSRIERSAEAEEELGSQKLREILEEAAQLCAPAAAKKDIDLRIVCQNGVEARMNPSLIEQGVVNLIDNAIKYSEQGQVVEVCGEPRNGEVVISVRDHGCGISSEHVDRIFERFYRVDKARSRELGGTGLGLSIVRHIAQAHGGRVSVKSAPGEGSVFSIHLPCL